MTLTKKILIALVLGVVIGIAINNMKSTSFFPILDTYFVNGIFHVLGSIFVRLLQFMMIPVVVSSLVMGVTNLSSVSQLTKIGTKVLLLFMTTTMISIGLAISLSYLFKIGYNYPDMALSATNVVNTKPTSITTLIIEMFPANILSPLSQGVMLQVIVLSIIVGIAIITMKEGSDKVINIWRMIEKVSLSIVSLVMKFSPYGVFGLVAKIFSQQGFNIIDHIALYAFVVLLALAIAMFFFQPLIVLMSGLNPITYLKKSWNVSLIGFSTSSSNATLPVTIDTAKNKLGISDTVAGFVLPLGATINMNGTSIMLGAATIFIANIYGINLSLLDVLGIVALATIAAFGTAGVPGAGIIMLSMILVQYNIPLDGIAIILTVDRFLDMCRTSVNIMGDIAVATYIAKKENAINLEVYNSK